MKFQTPIVEDAKWAVPLLEANNFMASEFAFTNIFVWQDYVNTKIARFKDFIVIRVDYKGNFIDYQYPSGKGDIRQVIDAILKDAEMGDRPPAITIIPDEGKELLEKYYPDFFTFTNSRGDRDYVHLSSDLANLSGRKFQKKRNHCSRFERLYPNWEFKFINEDVIDDILDFTLRWIKQSDKSNTEGIANELAAIKRSLGNYFSLGLKGGYLTVDEEIVAYSYGSSMGDEFIIHVEKGMYNIDGVYSVINREIARTIGKDYTYINREEDLGEPGLRKAKESYRPEFLVNKWRAEPKEWGTKE